MPRTPRPTLAELHRLRAALAEAEATMREVAATVDFHNLGTSKFRLIRAADAAATALKE